MAEVPLASDALLLALVLLHNLLDVRCVDELLDLGLFLLVHDGQREESLVLHHPGQILHELFLVELQAAVEKALCLRVANHLLEQDDLDVAYAIAIGGNQKLKFMIELERDKSAESNAQAMAASLMQSNQLAQSIVLENV